MIIKLLIIKIWIIEIYPAAQFVRKYHLMSSISVVSAIRGLLEKDFITQNNGTY